MGPEDAASSGLLSFRRAARIWMRPAHAAAFRAGGFDLSKRCVVPLPVVHDSAKLPSVTPKIRGSVFTHPCELAVHNPSSVGGTLPITLGEQSMSVFKRFLRDESGATAIEYGLIAAGISVAIIATVNTLGGQLKNTFSNVSGQLGNAGK
jgi:pilus assembly protein Flp/PilA